MRCLSCCNGSRIFRAATPESGCSISRIPTSFSSISKVCAEPEYRSKRRALRALLVDLAPDASAVAVKNIKQGAATSRSAMGHVWTAPWQELSDVAAALVGCGHVSGLLMRQVWPLALMLCADQVPIKLTHLEVR